MKTKEILETIKSELDKMSPNLDYNFSISSDWKQGNYTKMEFSINEKANTEGNEDED